MGRIMLATSANTDEEYGGTFGSTVVLSIPANTYNTWALALAALETAFDALNNNDKMKAVIVNSGNILRMQNLFFKSFSKVHVYSGKVYTTTFNLADHKLEETTASSTFAYNDYSSWAQSSQVDLYII